MYLSQQGETYMNGVIILAFSRFHLTHHPSLRALSPGSWLGGRDGIKLYIRMLILAFQDEMDLDMPYSDPGL